MGREEERNKKKKKRRRKRKRKKIRSNPSAHLPVIKTYNSREPSAKPCPRPLSYLSSSFPPSFPARTSQERVFIFIFALHLAPYALLHISYFVPQLLYRASMDFGPLPFPPWRMREGRGEYLSSCQHRGPNTNVHPGGRRKRFEFRNRGNRRSWKCETRLFSSFLFFFKYIWGQRWGETRGNFCERSVCFFEIFKVYRGDSHPKTKSEIRERRGESNFESIIRWYPRGRKRRIHAHTRAHSSKQNLLRKRDVPLFCRATQKRTHVSKHFVSSNFICAINIERQLTPKGFFFFVSEEKDDLRFHPPALEGSEKAGKIEGRK